MMLRLFALGLLATIMGVGSLVNGSIGSGIALILIGVGVGGYPGFRYFTSQRASWRMTASLRERSPAADDPVLGPRFLRYGKLAVFAAVFPLTFAAFVVFATFAFQSQGSNNQRALAITLITGLFAMVPLILGLKVIEGSRQLRHGIILGAGTIKTCNWLCSVIAALLIVLTLIVEIQGTGSTIANWIAIGVAMLAWMTCVAVNTLMTSLIRQTRGLEFQQT
jgi:hypothetical protein